MGGNEITTIDPGDFTGLNSLAFLGLAYNHIASVQAGDFTELGDLTGLDLRRNQITNVKWDDLVGLGSLEVLDLSYNQIASIESGDSSAPGKLTALNLGYNQITSVGSGAFAALGSLTHLTLCMNYITSIESGDFAPLENLTGLDLGGNQITSIGPGDFTGLDKLTSLNLGSNQITSIESGDFPGLSDLRGLCLTANQITTIESGDFAGLSNLRELCLTGNQITTIESVTLAGLTNLESLHLGYNHALTDLNLEGADFSNLVAFNVEDDRHITRVSLRGAVLNQTSLTAIIDGETAWKDGIGELRRISELDLSGVDFSEINDLTPLYKMRYVTSLWLVDVKNLDADALDVLLDGLRLMQHGVLYLTQADFDAFNTAGGGKLALWDAEPGHHVQIVVPEPGTLVMPAGAVGDAGTDPPTPREPSLTNAPDRTIGHWCVVIGHSQPRAASRWPPPAPVRRRGSRRGSRLGPDWPWGWPTRRPCRPGRAFPFWRTCSPATMALPASSWMAGAPLPWLSQCTKWQALAVNWPARAPHPDAAIDRSPERAVDQAHLALAPSGRSRCRPNRCCPIGRRTRRW